LGDSRSFGLGHDDGLGQSVVAWGRGGRLCDNFLGRARVAARVLIAQCLFDVLSVEPACCSDAAEEKEGCDTELEEASAGTSTRDVLRFRDGVLEHHLADLLMALVVRHRDGLTEVSTRQIIA
jgi:hypothetical protein